MHIGAGTNRNPERRRRAFGPRACTWGSVQGGSYNWNGWRLSHGRICTLDRAVRFVQGGIQWATLLLRVLKGRLSCARMSARLWL